MYSFSVFSCQFSDYRKNRKLVADFFMKKQIFGRKFKRDANQRTALFKGLMSELVMHGRIKTTEQKAKAIRASAEKLIAKGQKEVLLARKLLGSELIPEAIEKMITDIAPKFVSRNGGYTRIIKLGRRFNDDASMVVIEWVEGIGIKNKELRIKNKVEKPKVTKAKPGTKKPEVKKSAKG